MLQGPPLIENFFCRLKQFTGQLPRYDKTAPKFLGCDPLAAASSGY